MLGYENRHIKTSGRAKDYCSTSGGGSKEEQRDRITKEESKM